MFDNRDSRIATFALCLMALLGVSLVFIFPGCPEQDSEYHFLMARMAWGDPSYFVDVWARPLYTLIFSLPALLGFIPARIFGVGIGVATAWQTWRLARDLNMPRAWLVILLLLAQPVFFELFPDLLTEPLFALVFVTALRWHLRGWTKRGMLCAALLPLARPEGFFVCILWGLWVLAAERAETRELFSKRRLQALLSITILASGVFAWWIAALCITRDPLHILHDWPATWHREMYGHGNWISYSERSHEFVGVLLLVPFLIGMWRAVRRKGWLPAASACLLLFLLHSFFRAYGLLGEAGYPRYMVSVAPAIALLTLKGWNAIALWTEAWPRLACRAVGTAVVVGSLALSFLYLDSFPWARDAVAIRDTFAWLHEQPGSYERLIWSNARMCIASGFDPAKSPGLVSGNREDTIAALCNAPAGTLVCWDDHIGPEWFGLYATDIAKAGYEIIRVHHYSLPGILRWNIGGKKSEERELELSLLRKKD